MSTDPHVLVVDDDPSIRETITLALELEGIPVRSAVDGSQALRMLRNGTRPRVILLDLMMPGMNGWDFRRHQLADPAIADIPVVVFSGAGEPGEHARKLGADAWLGKPVTLETLVRTMRRYVPPPGEALQPRA